MNNYPHNSITCITWMLKELIIRALSVYLKKIKLTQKNLINLLFVELIRFIYEFLKV